MTYAGMTRTLEGLGYNPDTTPVDVLMGAPCGVGMTVSEDLCSDHDYPDSEPHPREGFQNELGDMMLSEITLYSEDGSISEDVGLVCYPDPGSFFGWRKE